MYSAIAANKRNTFFIMAIFVAIVAALGWIFGYFYQSTGIFWAAFGGSLVYVLFEYYVADKIALAVNGAKPIAKADNPELYNVVENLAITNGLPMPKVYIIQDPAMNAFATGRDPQHSSVAVTAGLLQTLNKTELQAVMAHELGHVKNYDIRVSLITFGLVSVIGLVSDLFLRMLWFSDDDDRPSNPLFIALSILAVILAPIVAMLVQLAVSRQREFLADATAAMTTRYPQALISALEKISFEGSVLSKQNGSTAHLFFANPLKRKTLVAMFSTHPPIEKRIERLQKMKDEF